MQLSRTIPEFSRTVVVKDNRIFCSGGQDPLTNESLDSVFEIDIEENYRIKEKASMRQSRFHHTMVHDNENEFIFAIGGMVGDVGGS